MTKNIFLVALWLGVGIVSIDILIYWYNAGFGFEWGVVAYSFPSIIFTWIAMSACTIAVRCSKRNGAVIAVLLLLGVHVAALVFFLNGLFSWREGSEYAELFSIHLIFTILVLSIWVVRPIIRAKPSQAEGPSG